MLHDEHMDLPKEAMFLSAPWLCSFGFGNCTAYSASVDPRTYQALSLYLILHLGSLFFSTLALDTTYNKY